MSAQQPLKKKKVLIHTDFVLAKTGFGRSAKAVFEYLYKTGKYDLINLAVGSANVHSEIQRTPWKTIPAVNIEQLEQIKKQNDPRNWEPIERMAGYAAYQIDATVKAEKPDVYIGVQDIWGIDFSVEKPWFNKITSALWTTLDSLPILPKAVELGPKVKNYWSWADFATKALHKLGHSHVKTIRGAIETRYFHRLTDGEKLALRNKHRLDSEDFIVGFVFRNQLRKSVPNLLQGFKSFQRDNPMLKTKLLLHTCWTEGWDIPTLLKEHEIKKEDVLTTYVCKACLNYQVRPHGENEEDCPHCKAQKTFVTTHPSIGVTEKQLNEIYNLMNVYCHPFTSGGQEIPIQEAKLAELITLVTNYSCGEDSCTPEAASLPLDWAEYREPGTQFIKASTRPASINKQLNRVLRMKESDKREMGRKGRKWVLENFSIESIGRFLEEFIDAAPFTEYDFEEKFEPRNPFFQTNEIKDDAEWVLSLYHNILMSKDVTPDNDGVKHWLARLKEGMPRAEIDKYFRQVAMSDNQKNNMTQNKFEDLLGKDDKGRVILVMPESTGDIFLLSALFKSIKSRYKDWTFYVATKPEYKEILDGNPYVDKWLEYSPMMDNLIWLEGNAKHNGYFDVAYLPYVQTQRMLSYLHNGKDKIDFKLTE